MTAPKPVAPGRGITWRPRTKREGNPYKCGVLGLVAGPDCSQQAAKDSVYCVYHDKVERGLIATFMATGATCEWVDASPNSIFPVYPLPRGGYVLLESEEAA